MPVTPLNGPRWDAALIPNSLKGDNRDMFHSLAQHWHKIYLVCVCHKLNFHRTANFASVSDTNPPDAAFANCSSDILTNNKTVTYEEPSATDLSDDGENLEVSCDYPPGSTFPENNMTLVICTARDSARNIAAENCNFTVTVGEEGS